MLAKVGINVGTNTLVIMARKMPPLVTGTLVDTAGTFRFTGDQLPILANIARNDGKLGEQIAAQLMKDTSGKDFVPIQNASGHGADLVYIDQNTKTIYHVEVKTNQVGATGGVPMGNLEEMFNGWVTKAKTGELNGQVLSPAMKDMANNISRLQETQGYTVSHNLMQIEIPRAGNVGKVFANLRPWPPKP